MGRPEAPLGGDASPVRDFAFWLRSLRSRSDLTYRQLSTRTGYSTSTLQEALAGRRLPTLAVALAVVEACEDDPAAWHARWTLVRQTLDRDAPADLARLGVPPWPPSPAGSDGDQGWYVEEASALLRLDLGITEAVERRTVVATAGPLSELATGVSVPRRHDDDAVEHGLDLELLYGGRLEAHEQPYESYFRQSLVLPTPLRAGERHTYAMRLRLPPGQPMAPHFVHVPLLRSDSFRLCVRFDRARPPQAVWRVDGVPTAVIYERRPGSAVLQPDESGEVRAEFSDMRVGYGYGLCWQDRAPAPSAG
jgi:hypothetical protein